MSEKKAPPLAELERRVAEITSEKGEIPWGLITVMSRLEEDLNVDSLTLIEIVMALEEEFGVVMPDKVDKQISAGESVSEPLTVGALAKVVERQWGTGTRKRG